MKITIATDFDFTPIGKRTVRLVTTSRGSQLRGYVGTRLWFKGGMSPERALEWRDNTTKLCPQPWATFL